ncbi:MAG: hypothetical protein QOG87_3803 [Actinomycetota bacterium]
MRGRPHQVRRHRDAIARTAPCRSPMWRGSQPHRRQDPAGTTWPQLGREGMESPPPSTCLGGRECLCRADQRSRGRGHRRAETPPRTRGRGGHCRPPCRIGVGCLARGARSGQGERSSRRPGRSCCAPSYGAAVARYRHLCATSTLGTLATLGPSRGRRPAHLAMRSPPRSPSIGDWRWKGRDLRRDASAARSRCPNLRQRKVCLFAKGRKVKVDAFTLHATVPELGHVRERHTECPAAGGDA